MKNGCVQVILSWRSRYGLEAEMQHKAPSPVCAVCARSCALHTAVTRQTLCRAAASIYASEDTSKICLLQCAAISQCAHCRRRCGCTPLFLEAFGCWQAWRPNGLEILQAAEILRLGGDIVSKSTLPHKKKCISCT